jgi:hypothetical protein
MLSVVGICMYVYFVFRTSLDDTGDKAHFLYSKLFLLI